MCERRDVELVLLVLEVFLPTASTCVVPPPVIVSAPRVGVRDAFAAFLLRCLERCRPDFDRRALALLLGMRRIDAADAAVEAPA